MEQEAFNIGLLSQPALQAEFMKVYSSSTTHRSEMLGDLLTRNLKDIKEFSLPDDNVPSSSTQTVRALFKGLGVTIRNIEE